MAAGSDQHRVCAALSDFVEDRMADEFRSVVRSHEQRNAVNADQTGRHDDYQATTNRAGHVNGQALLREIVDHRRSIDLMAACGGIEHEVVYTTEVGFARRRWSRPAGGDAPPWSQTKQLRACLAPPLMRQSMGCTAWLESVETCHS